MKIKLICNFIKEEYKKDALKSVCWFVLIFLSLVIYLTMYYGDNHGMFATSLWNVNSAACGNIEWLFTSVNTAYGLGHQIICELWTVPIYILYLIFGIEVVNSIFAILWYKAIAVLFFVLVLKKISKISKLYKIENIDELLMYFMSAILVILPIFHIAQTDVIYLFFMLWGIEEYLEEKKWKALILFAIAFPMKYLSLMVVIPLVLIVEKRIMYIIRDLLVTFSLFPIEKVIRFIANRKVLATVYGSESTMSSESIAVAEANASAIDPMTSHFLHKILYFEFQGVRKGLTVYPLVLIFVLLCIWCYMQKKDDDGEWKMKFAYASSFSLMLFFLLASPSPYWIVIQYPFIILVLFINKEKIRINFIIENAYSLGMFFVFIMNTYWVFGGACTFDWLLLNKLGLTEFIGTLQEGICMAGYFNKLGGEYLLKFATSITLACAIAMAVINYPGYKYSDEMTIVEKKKFIKYTLLFRIGFIAVWVLMNMILVGRVIIGR